MRLRALPILAGMAIVQVCNHFWKRRQAKKETSRNSEPGASHGHQNESQSLALITRNDIPRIHNEALNIVREDESQPSSLSRENNMPSGNNEALNHLHEDGSQIRSLIEENEVLWENYQILTNHCNSLTADLAEADRLCEERTTVIHAGVLLLADERGLNNQLRRRLDDTSAHLRQLVNEHEVNNQLRTVLDNTSSELIDIQLRIVIMVSYIGTYASRFPCSRFR